MRALAILALGAILHPSITVRDVDGISTREPLKVEKGARRGADFRDERLPDFELLFA